MKSYKVTITETLRMTVEVEASSRYEAQKMVEEQWRNSDHILDSDNFVGVKFRCDPPQKDRGSDR